MRYDHRRGSWFIWAEHHWRADDDGEVLRLAVQTARQRYAEAPAIADLSARDAEARFAIASENRARLEAMLHVASCQRSVATAGDSWDRDPLVFAVANGVVDLERGRLRPGRPEEMISLCSPVRFDAEAGCPRWKRFLEEVFAGDELLIDWIWRLVGYLLSGETGEQFFVLLFGLGANGKSTLLKVLSAMLGDYAYNAPFSTFEAGSRAQIPNDLAALVGRRLVTSSETGESTPLNEARLKMLTGGDAVTARFLHREFFSFVPVAKLVLAVNHKPPIRDFSHGFWRRVRLVPFEVRFEGDAADEHLEEKLQGELPGILAWAVAGYAEWRERGLDPPPKVRVATADYRADSDPLAAFLADRCQVAAESRLPAADAWTAYTKWAEEQVVPEAERPYRNRFYKLLESHYPKRHTKAGNVYLGLRLGDAAELTFEEAMEG